MSAHSLHSLRPHETAETLLRMLLDKNHILTKLNFGHITLVICHN